MTDEQEEMVAIPKEVFDLALTKANLELIQKVDTLLNLLMEPASNLPKCFADWQENHATDRGCGNCDLRAKCQASQPNLEKIADDLQALCDEQALRIGRLEALLAQTERCRKEQHGNGEHVCNCKAGECPELAQPEQVTDEENERFSDTVSNFKGADPEATKYALEEFLRNRVLAQPKKPEQEPVAFITPLMEQQMFDDWCPYKGNPDPRVVWAAAIDAVNGLLLGATTSPQRKPLTRAQVKGLLFGAGYDKATTQERADFISGIRHAEAAHGIKEQTC
jgi:hypothetical protein